MNSNMNSKIKKISEYSDIDLQHYFDTEDLDELHQIKLYSDDKYYNTGKSSGFEDYQYDNLKETLQKRDPDYVVPIGVRIREGENRVKIPYWLGSMDKFKPEDERDIDRWIVENQASEYIVEDKLDGVSCLMIVNNGKTKLYTRGDGVVGADISYLAQYFKTIPKKLQNINIAIRGELIMKKDTFETKYSSDYANPRNMVAGRLGGKTIRKGLGDIDFIAYEIVDESEMPKPSEQLEYLSSLGFSVVKTEIIDSITIEKLMEMFVIFRKQSPFEIDGVIIQSNIPYERNTSGNPDYAFAFKMRMSSNLVDTVVEEVEWNVSKWGALKPRVKINPVSLGGVTITYTTGFNGKYIQDNKIGPGAVIKITRSGDVIPYIVEVLSEAFEPSMPEIPYKWNESGVDIFAEDNPEIMCIKLISSFFNKLGIKHISEATVSKMYEGGFNSLLKIISASKDELATIKSFGNKSVERVYNNIHNGLQNVSKSLVLGSSGVFGYGIGIRKITILMDAIPNILVIYKNLSSEELYDMVILIEGFSVKTAIKIVKNIRWADILIQKLLPFATFKSIEKISDSLKGMKFIFSSYRNKSLEQDIIKRGGKITTSVSSQSSGVIVLSKQCKASGKVKKAMDLGIQVYTEEDFISEYM
jgi:DNA ligase (NAD+)